MVAATQAIPETIGDWQQTGTRELGENAQSMLQCFTDEIRVYENSQTGRQIQVALIFGPSGPVSVHTPDICYSSREYRALDDRQHVAPENQLLDDQFWAIDFEPRSLEGGALKSIYGWSTDGHWQAPEVSRFAYAGEPYLFKVEFAARGDSIEQLNEDESILDFVGQYCSLFRKQLRAATGESEQNEG